MGVTWTKDDLGTNVRETHSMFSLNNILYFHHHFSKEAHVSLWTFISSCISTCFACGVFPDWDCLVSFSTEGDSRRGGAAGVFCCLSMSTGGGRASLRDPADVKQLHRFPPNLNDVHVNLLLLRILLPKHHHL